MSPDLKKSLTPLALSGTVVESYISNEQWYRLFVHSETTKEELDDEAHKALFAHGSPCFCLEPCNPRYRLRPETGIFCRVAAYDWCGADCQGCCGPDTGCYLKADEVD